MSTQLFSITWASSGYAPLLMIVLLAVLALLVVRYKKTITFAHALVHKKWLGALLKNFSANKILLKSSLMFVGIVFLSLALMRPQWRKKDQKVQQEGRDLFIALDISRSMLAQDVKPNRLERAKTKIKTLLKQLQCERVGLIVFSGTAFVHCPLTTDFNAFNLFLDQVDTQTIASGTTAIDQAIAKTLEVYAHMPGKKSKLLVVITDGEDFSSNLAELKKRAIKQGLHIFALGVGTSDGAPIPYYNNQGRAIGHVRDKEGRIVISQLNEGIVRSLAHDVGGLYVSVTDNDTDVKKIVHEVEQFEKEQFDRANVSMLEEQYPWFVAISFICFVLEWVL